MPRTGTRLAYLCPECDTEMTMLGGWWCHVESTDCSPEPWPTLLDCRAVVINDAGEQEPTNEGDGNAPILP